MTEMSPFAYRIYKQKYSMDQKEEWADTASRVVNSVLGAVPRLPIETQSAILDLVTKMKFVPGGRYLYAAGREFHQLNNCALLRAEDSREGWADLMQKTCLALMTGAGIGVDYSAVRPEGETVKRTGGLSTGPLALMQMVNEAGRHIMQGGARRSAIYASLRWSHKDIFKFINIKNWSADVKKLKEKDFNFPATLDGTNISVILDKEFFDAYAAGDKQAQEVYWNTVRSMLETGEPGFQIDYDNPKESLRNAPVTAATRVLTSAGYQSVGYLIDKPVTLWTGKRWAENVVFKLTKQAAALVRVQLNNGRSIVCDPEHPFMVRKYLGAGKRKRVFVERVAAKDLVEGAKIAADLPLASVESGTDRDYGLGFVYGDGSIKNGRGELSLHVESKRFAYETAVRGINAHHATDPGRSYFKCQFSDKDELISSSLSPKFIAGWFDADGNVSRNLLRISNRSRLVLCSLQESLDRLGIQSIVREDGESSFKPGNKMYTLLVLSGSLARFKEVIPTLRVCFDLPANWKPYRESEIRVTRVEHLAKKEDVYCCDVGHEEHSFMAEGVLISNCTEVTSEDDSDICNLGSLNLAKFDSLEDFRTAVEYATVLLLAGTIYSDVPYPKIQAVRNKNRRLGLGLMGVHEWLLKRGKRYGEDTELASWLTAYRDVADATAERVATAWGISQPVKTRAIAPTGTIGIISGTSTGIEPVFCVAYRRRYKASDGIATNYEYVLDPTADRLIQSGVPVGLVEDAYDLAADPERRVAFQAWVQQYVDQGISSTINLPPWGSELNNEDKVRPFGEMLLKYLPRLRGITVYPDGARGGQPLVRVEYETALKHKDQVFLEQADVCEISGKGGTCGS